MKRARSSFRECRPKCPTCDKSVYMAEAVQGECIGAALMEAQQVARPLFQDLPQILPQVGSFLSQQASLIATYRCMNCSKTLDALALLEHEGDVRSLHTFHTSDSMTAFLQALPYQAIRP
jgi:hypothetical protein